MQGVADHRRVLVQLLLHEVAEIALADGGAGQPGELDFALNLVAVDVEELGTLAVHHGPVAVAQIGDAAGQRRQRQGIGTDEHLVVAEADRQRGAVLGADDQLRMAGEDHGQGVGTLQPPQRRAGGFDGLHAAFQVQIDKLGDGLGIRFGAELLTFGFEFGAQFGVVFDYPVVHQRHT